VFFPDYGLLAYDAAGKELWQMRLGPFNNIYGMGASPVIVGDQLVLACDQSIGSFLLSVNKKTGKELWRTPRPEAKSGHATPILWKAPDGRDQLLLPGSFQLTAYDAMTGEKRWWVRGLSVEIKSTPVVHGDTLYINGYAAPENDLGRRCVADGRHEQGRCDLQDGVPEILGRVLVHRGRLELEWQPGEGRVGVLPRGPRVGKRHAGDSPRRIG
jgi:hypothetical protein